MKEPRKKRPGGHSKTIIRALFLIAIAATAVFLTAKGLQANAYGMEETAVKANAQGHKVIAYYFHGIYRCATCRKIEDLTRQAIKEGFPEDLKQGRLEYRVVNVEQSGNEHFIKDYQLFTKSVIIVDMQGGKQMRWKNLNKVWEYVLNREAFLKYIQGEVKAYLG